MTQTASTTTLVFTRPLSPSDTAKHTLSADEEDEATFLWAYGETNTLARHDSRGAVTVGDLFCAETSEDDDDDDEDADASLAGSCESSDPDFEFEVSPHENLALLWNVVDGGTAVSVKVRSRGVGWVPGGEGWEGTHVMRGRSRITVDPRIPTMPGRSTSGFYRPGRHC